MILIDANVFMYAAGSSHPNKVPSVGFLHDVARGRYESCINAEILQEILHRYRAINQWQAGREVYTLAKQIVPAVRSVTAEMTDKAVELMDRYPSLLARDCLHAAHCILEDLEAIYSFDRDLDIVTEVKRVDPGSIT